MMNGNLTLTLASRKGKSVAGGYRCGKRFTATAWRYGCSKENSIGITSLGEAIFCFRFGSMDVRMSGVCRILRSKRQDTKKEWYMSMSDDNGEFQIPAYT
jgi:hypothetical protein